MITKIMRVVACIAMIPVFIVPFLSMFIWQSYNEYTKITTNSDGIMIFADWSNTGFNTVLLNIASVMLVILCVVGAIYLILVASSFFVKNDLVNKLIKFAGLILTILALITTVLLLITPLTTTYKGLLGNTHTIVLTGTAYMVISGIVAGVVAVVAEKIKK